MKFSVIVNLFSLYISLPFQTSAVGKSKIGHDWLNVPIPKKRKTAPTKYNFMSEATGFTSDHLRYHIGQPVLTDPLDIFCKLIVITKDIFYGNWSARQNDILVLENMAKYIGNTSWYGIMKDYYFQESPDAEKVYVSGQVNFVASVHDNYSLGSYLSGNNVLEIIQRQIDLPAIPERYSALYFVLTSPDVHEEFETENLGIDYCGYHYTGTLKSNQKVFYSLVGHPQGFKGCIDSVSAKTPNGPAIDSMASTIAHELVEAVSDPDDDDHRAWEDSEFSENGDKCSVMIYKN